MTLRVVSERPLSAEEQAALEQDMADLNDLLALNPLVGYNNPVLGPVHPKQIPFHEATTRVKVYTGGTRAGKSSAGIVDDLIQLLPRELVPEHLLKFKRKDPPFKLRMVTPDLGTTLSEMQSVIRDWCPAEAYKGGSWDTAYKGDKRILRFECGSMVDFLSFETDLDKFGSVARDRVHIDEEPPGEKGYQIYIQCLRRLVDYQGDLLLTATPEFGLSWTSEEFWDERGPEIEDRVWQNEWLTIVRASTHDNPFVPQDELSESRMSAEEYKVKVLGEWYHLKGKVYKEYDEKIHVVDAPKIDHVKDLETIVGIDPGVNTTAVVFAGFDKDNAMLVYDELYLHDEDAIPENAAKKIRAKLGEWGIEEPKWFVIDPSARNRALTDAQRVQTLYLNAGIRAYEGQNDRETGVFEMKRRLQSDPSLFYVSRDCEKFRWEIQRYRIDEKADGAFDTIKKDDHIMDATRYAAMARPLPPSSISPEEDPAKKWRYGFAPAQGDEYKPVTDVPPLGVMS